MMKICEGEYSTSHSLIEYHGNLFYMLHNEIRPQTFQKKVVIDFTMQKKAEHKFRILN